jgi:hypothetical protein
VRETNAPAKCQDFVYASRANGWVGGKCGRPVKRGGRCGIHARQVEQQAAAYDFIRNQQDDAEEQS